MMNNNEHKFAQPDSQQCTYFCDVPKPNTKRRAVARWPPEMVG